MLFNCIVEISLAENLLLFFADTSVVLNCNPMKIGSNTGGQPFSDPDINAEVTGFRLDTHPYWTVPTVYL